MHAWFNVSAYIQALEKRYVKINHYLSIFGCQIFYFKNNRISTNTKYKHILIRQLQISIAINLATCQNKLSSSQSEELFSANEMAEFLNDVLTDKFESVRQA